MKLTQFFLGTVAAAVLMTAAATASADEPRSYETYDDIGLIYFEDVKPLSPNVKAAWGLYRSGAYKAAYDRFERLVLADKFDDEAILGWIASAKRLGTTSALLKKAETSFRARTNKDLYALSLVRTLLSWSAQVEAKGDGDVQNWLIYAQMANRKGLLPNLRSALISYGIPKEKRKLWDELCEKYPKSEGMKYYRCKAYITGDLGGGYIDPDTHKIVNTSDKANFPRPEVALQIAKPYLERPDMPKWAAYVAFFAYNALRQTEKLERYRKIIEAAAQTGNPVYIRWNNNIQKIVKRNG